MICDGLSTTFRFSLLFFCCETWHHLLEKSSDILRCLLFRSKRIDYLASMMKTVVSSSNDIKKEIVALHGQLR